MKQKPKQKIIRAIKIVKPYHAQALVDGWLCIKYLDGSEESLSTFADVSKGDMILYGNATRSCPAPAAPDYTNEKCGSEKCMVILNRKVEERTATTRDQILDDIQKGEEPTSYTWRKAESLRRTKE